MPQFLLAEAAGETFPLARGDGGTIQCQPSVGGGSVVGSLVLIFPTIAALEAYNASSPQVLQQGQLAVVQSNNSLWELSPGTEGEVDNITVASVTNPPAAIVNAVWTRNLSLSPATYIGQPGWHINPATGNDEATGADAAHPIKTNAEVFRRWGYTWQPSLLRTVVITYHANQTDDSDPALYEPLFNVGTQFTLNAARPAPTFTGTLNVVTAKNRESNQVLETTFTTATGAPANGMLLVNTTRGNSEAWIVDGGPTFRISQPLAPYAGGDATVVTEVDTWAHGDSVQGFVLIQQCVARCAGDATEFAASSVPQYIINNLELVDFSGNESSLEVDGPANFAAITCFIARAPSIRSTWAFTTINNCFTPVVASSTASVALNLSYRAGVVASVVGGGQGVFLDNDVMIVGGGVQCQSLAVGTCFADTGLQVAPLGGLSAIAGPLYGGASLNVSGLCEYTAPASGATGSLPLSGGILINGAASAYSNSTTAGTTTVHLVTLTAAHLDAAAGAAGFNGLAWNAGSGLTTGTAT